MGGGQAFSTYRGEQTFFHTGWDKHFFTKRVTNIITPWDSSQGMRDCKRCDYVAEDRYEMDGHLWSEHEDDEDGTIICKCPIRK